jgi:hypothetical protein
MRIGLQVMIGIDEEDASSYNIYKSYSVLDWQTFGWEPEQLNKVIDFYGMPYVLDLMDAKSFLTLYAKAAHENKIETFEVPLVLELEFSDFDGWIAEVEIIKALDLYV